MHYEAEVNKGSLNMGSFTRTLNRRWEAGWRLSHIYQQDENHIMVWEQRTEPTFHKGNWWITDADGQRWVSDDGKKFQQFQQT